MVMFWKTASATYAVKEPATGKRALAYKPRPFLKSALRCYFLTFSVTDVMRCRLLPLVPVTVSTKLPMGVVELVLTVIIEEAETDVATDSGLGPKLALTPLGSPLTVKVTFPVNPPEGMTVTV